MTEREFSSTFWPKLTGLWPNWPSTESERMAWGSLTRSYALGACVSALTFYWQENNGGYAPRPQDFLRHLRFQPSGGLKTEEQRIFEAEYYATGPAVSRIVTKIMAERRLVQNRYEYPSERDKDERLVTTMDAFIARQVARDPEFVAAESEAWSVLDRVADSIRRTNA